MSKGDFLKKEDLSKQLKFVNYIDVNLSEKIKIEGKRDGEIEIIENIEPLNIYKNSEGVFSIMEHIKTGNPEPLTTGFLFGGGLEKIQIKDIKIINYGNKCINLILSGIDKIGSFDYEKVFFPFNNEKDFDYLFNLYNQEKTNIYICKNNELINTRKIGNSLYLNEDLGDILLSIDKSDFIKDLELLSFLKNKILMEMQKDYSISDFVKKLQGKNYIFLETTWNEKINSLPGYNKTDDLLKTTYIYE